MAFLADAVSDRHASVKNLELSTRSGDRQSSKAIVLVNLVVPTKDGALAAPERL
jgi:hypothetical protein